MDTSLFFLLNFIFTLGSVIGFVLWSNKNTTEDYAYYSFCSIMNLLFVITGSCFHNKFEDNHDPEAALPEPTWRNKGIFTCLSFCYTVLWVFAALFSTLATKQCVELLEVNCSGVIMSTIFGYLLFILWSLSFFMSIL